MRCRRSAAARWASASSRDETSPARRRAAISWAGDASGQRSATAQSPPSPPRMAGTTTKSPSRAGALASASSTGSDGRATSSRRMFSSSIVWAVGGMASVSSSREDGVLVEDVVELALEARQLLVGQAEAGEVGDVLDVARGSGWPWPAMIAERGARAHPVPSSPPARSARSRPRRGRGRPGPAPSPACCRPPGRPPGSPSSSRPSRPACRPLPGRPPRPPRG